MAHMTGPRGKAYPVWICEYPYRTMRLSGPSSECAGCPVWHEIERSHAARATLTRLPIDEPVAS
jgi:hypothetical protein